MTPGTKRILVVDDQPHMLRLQAFALRRLGAERGHRTARRGATWLFCCPRKARWTGPTA